VSKSKVTRRQLLAGAGPVVIAGPLCTLAGSAPLLASDRQASHLGDHSIVGHAAMIGAEVPAPGGPHDLDELLLPPPALPHQPGRVREYTLAAYDKTIEVAQGVFFDAWTFNGTVPGPVIRATEDDLLRVNFVNAGAHPHTIHFHGIHPAKMDGVFEIVEPGDRFVYEFPARPYGMHLYHCHSTPLKKHIHKGLYGAFIVNPDPAKRGDAAKERHPDHPESQRWQEFVMVMNAFDTNFDGGNEVYAINSIAFHHMKHPIVIDKTRPIRVYLINVVEFDLANSLHLHANFFNYYDTGTNLEPTLKTVDTISQMQAQRGILEFDYSEHEDGLYMFHAHVSEFTELGWMAAFDVRSGPTA
jgi:manganese oxidase